MLQINSSIVSPNYNERLPGCSIEYIILHYTACDFDLSVDILTDAESDNPVSAHYLIDEKGKVFQLLDDAHRAWHAGVSCWRDRENLNTWSLGIEMVYLGSGSYAQPQLNSCLQLCKSLMQKYKIPLQNILGHSDIAPDRKADPGEQFDWQGFAKQGVGVYPFTVSASVVNTAAAKINDVAYIQKLLRDIGYKITCDGNFGNQTEQVMLAFQRHFYPEKVDGQIDVQGVARMLMLAGNSKMQH